MLGGLWGREMEERRGEGEGGEPQHEGHQNGWKKVRNTGQIGSR